MLRMAALVERPRADTTITMRVSAQTRALIDEAATRVDKTRTEFMLESARERALDILLDQRVFHLDEAASEAFAEALDRPPTPLEALRALVKSKAPWE
jgi:uncharacterized protein (DUF1778 family)